MNNTGPLKPRQSQALAASLPPIRIQQNVLERIQGLAKQAGITPSEAVRQILGEWVEQQEHPTVIIRAPKDSDPQEIEYWRTVEHRLRGMLGISPSRPPEMP